MGYSASLDPVAPFEGESMNSTEEILREERDECWRFQKFDRHGVLEGHQYFQ